MAGPNDPTTPAVNPAATTTTAAVIPPGALSELTEYTNKTEGLSVANQKVADAFTALGTATQGFGAKLSSLGNVASQGSATFGMMSAALIKTTESFRQMSNVDSGRVTGFMSQYEKLLATIKNSPAGSTAAKVAIDAFGGSMGKMGASSGTVARVVGDLQKGIVSTAESFLTGADNTLFYQNALLQTAAAQGSMADLLSKTGQGFQHLNDVATQGIQVMGASMGATNSTKEQMQAYMNTLKDLPGGLANFGQSMEVAGQKTTILTAAIQYAHGSGRDMAAIYGDMSEAMNSYGMQADNALKYSARMSEAAEALGARTEDVRTAVNRSSEAFKFFVFGGMDADKMTQGMTKSMEAYVSQLKAAGVPTKNAIDLAGDYADATAKMTDGQKAFLSQSSGGPGGMMGAAQMELLQKTDPEAFQKKYMDSIKKLMGGKIVTLEEAAKSQSAANQYEKEKMLISQGPLKLTSDPNKAGAIIEGLSKGNVPIPGTGRDLDQTVKAGQAVEDLSRTKVSQMNVEADNIMLQGGAANLSAYQNAATARSGKAGGVDGKGGGVNVDNQNQLKTYAASKTGEMPGHGKNPLTELKDSLVDIPSSLQGIGKSLYESYKGGNQQSIQEATSQMQAGIAQVKATTTDKGQMAAMDKLSASLANMKPSAGMDTMGTSAASGSLGVNQAIQKAKDEATATAGIAAGMGTSSFFRHTTTAGEQVGKSVAAGLGPGGEPVTGGKPGTTHQVTSGINQGNNGPVPVTLVGSSLTVNFTGKCPHCGSNIHSSEHAAINNAASVKS